MREKIKFRYKKGRREIILTMNKNKSYIFAGISIFLWSTLAASAKLMLNELSSIQLLCAGSFVAALCLFLVSVVTGKIKLFKRYTLKDWLVISSISLPGTFLYYIFYYAGTDILPASQAFIINYLWPIMSVVFACIILKEKMTPKKTVAILLSFLGVAIVTGADLLSFNKDVLSGALCCILGAVCYGLFTVLNKKMYYDKCISMMTGSLAAFVLSLVMLFVTGDLFIPTGTSQILGILWNGIFTLAIPNTLWIVALGNGNTAKISNLAYMTPFLSLIWNSIILNEQITVNSIIGLSVIILGILIQLKDKKEVVK